MSTEIDWVTVASGMGMYVAAPAAARGGVVVLQEAFGVNDHIQDVVRRFAAEGYLTVAPELFHRLPTRTLPYEELPAAKALMAQLGDGDVIDDVAAAVELVQARLGPEGRVALVGFCFGGTAAFLAATALAGVAATVSYYGSEIGVDATDAPHTRAAGIRSPMLVHIGADDPLIPGEAVDRIRKALAAAGVVHEVQVHRGAGHAFNCDARPAAFRRDVAEVAWDHTLAFIDRYVGWTNG